MFGDSLSERPLFGGAIATTFPYRFQDVSNIRLVPDHQEVFVDPARDESLIFELLDFKDDVGDNGSAASFLQDLATEQDAGGCRNPSPLHTTAIVEKCTLKLVDEYKHMLYQATEPMSTFLEYITNCWRNAILWECLTALLHWQLLLADTPLAPYFSECITSEDLDDMNIEIMRNTLYKAYLEDFYKFCQHEGLPRDLPVLASNLARLPRNVQHSSTLRSFSIEDVPTLNLKEFPVV
ncbi:hypothetical protein Dsin_007491 [Dipteronia sinensis]|uniref:Uncharacterized protein n=1 Tax=Dipteronia sinensis TaxID=43782 RepID=A0AAE0B1V5_9ROSI|nr:hypothetical protein Dsin_007491 [Dipteronia sinensis]